MKRERSITDLSQGEIVALTTIGNACFKNPRLCEDCFAFRVVTTCCPKVDKDLLCTAVQYFMRARELYTDNHLSNWFVLDDEEFVILRPQSEDEVNALVDYFIFCDIAYKVFGINPGVYDCQACCEYIFRFFDKKDISKRQFFLLSFGLHYAFD